MLNKLAGLLQGEKSNHPLGSTQNLDRTLSEIPLSDPSRVLLDVAILIEDPSRYDTELTPAAFRNAALYIDAFARSAYSDLLLAYLLPGTRWHASEIAWSALDRHNQLLFEAYEYALGNALRGNEDLSRAKMQLALCATRAMQAWVERKKLQHFRYRPPDLEWWLAAHKLVGLASQHNVISLVQPVYADDAQPRSTIHAYLAGLYLEIAPVSNLVPIQVEALHRWLQQTAGLFEFAEAPNPGTTHFISLHNPGNPTRYTSSVVHSPAMRYCSTQRLRAPLLQLAHNLRTQNVPEWLQPLMPQKAAIDKLMQTLMRYWTDQPPERSSPRQEDSAPMRVVHGFSMARRMIACSAFAKRGRSLNYRGTDMANLFNELRFGHSGEAPRAVEEDLTVDPMETLLKLETSGDKQMMDEWLKVDSSGTGIGAVMPGLRSRNRIGELVGFRIEGAIDWRLGIIRRIGRDKQKRVSIGIETLPYPSVCAQVRPSNVELTVWNEASEAGNGYVDAIQLEAEGDTLLLMPGLFVAELLVNLLVDGKRRDIILTEKIDHGNDWERVRFRVAETTPA
ncbi:MAG TPA: hypothetical protein VN028_06945 [Rhodocyclaceae bacterium]|nr:hypothetical protein [Rhodocyclaceae bacterium]